MSHQVLTYALTALAIVVVVLTRVRLGGDRQGGGNLAVTNRFVTWHTAIGLLAAVVWLVFLAVFGEALLGAVALAGWWVTALIGLLLLVRWLPSRGRHAGGVSSDSWLAGRLLSFLGHLGVFGCVCYFTWAYVSGAV